MRVAVFARQRLSLRQPIRCLLRRWRFRDPAVLPLLTPLLLPLPLLMPIVLIMLRAALPVVRPLHWRCHVALLYLRELPKIPSQRLRCLSRRPWLPLFCLTAGNLTLAVSMNVARGAAALKVPVSLRLFIHVGGAFMDRRRQIH